MGTPDTGKIKHSDMLIETIRNASSQMSFDEYAKVTGLDKEFIFAILNGEIEEVDRETWNRLSLKN
ncbi:MAG TPA: hypothetical protein DEF39_07960 [Hungateiclostridium thermocellum]|uniref:Uncharacterized protein n=2 Tax=Acetivibrio thermocellus TaxID=1515 RepID=G2JCB2_ACET2|nr:hypothetical protein [Acetivibrio thermocellus]CDG36476.1 hypothetical protein CTHBC1_1855 [Acetivibrio thermocellus BC1]ADU75629.1 hypothetical protein Clo1313_2629 [Acetivibrio thermocellus DSM 1313]AEO12434.1 hypothetical protein Cthe_3375 [Acetivibrio thermocellus ATCC 27405]ALX09623.1 hypothetical protein AD2_02643 [Acetivibrio thermocellus AD2]ANV77397.1 hypothetical protein LQRI_2656 [Acetivibrio thermocellus DSM 2360]